jgi:amino acid permease
MPVKAMRYGIWTRWAAAAVFASLAACTAEEWAQFNKEMEQNQTVQTLTDLILDEIKHIGE